MGYFMKTAEKPKDKTAHAMTLYVTRLYDREMDKLS